MPIVLALMLWLIGTPLRAGELTWAYRADVLTLDPHASNKTFTNAFLGNIYESLVRRDDRIEIDPALASSWKRPNPTICASRFART